MHRYRRYLLCLLSTLALVWQLRAQYTLDIQARSALLPAPDQVRSAARMQRLPQRTLLLPALPATAFQEALGASERGARVYTFALERKLELGGRDLGEYLCDAAGNYSWRTQIEAQGARNLSLRFSHFALPRGGRLYITASDGQVIGALTEQNNSPDSLLQLRPLPGQTLTLQYDFPEGAHPELGELPFRLYALYHGFRTWHPEDDAYDTAHPGEPLYDLSESQGIRSLLCAPNVLNYPQRWEQTRSVLLIMVGGTQSSSAALINNTRSDGTPYVLTSAHCINNLYTVQGLANVRQQAATTVFFFGYQSPQRTGYIRPAQEQTLSGASLVAYNEESDMCLLRIEGLPRSSSGQRLPIPESYNPYFAGWNRGEAPSAPFFGIHHPASSTKRYSESSDRSLSIVDYDLSFAGGRDWYGKHWQLRAWRVGTTAAGSSGSPLFDRDGLILGALSGGSSTCSSPYNDYYWAIARSWIVPSGSTTQLEGLAPHLDPSGSNATTCRGYDPLSPQQVQRLSLFYPDPTAPERSTLSPTQIYQPERSIRELGNVFALPSEQRMRILGAYIVFKSTSTLADEQLPQVGLQLSRLERSGLAQPLLDFTSTRMGAYNAYDRGRSGFYDLRRATRLDSIEGFFPNPNPEELTLPTGDYLLSLRSLSGDSLALPLLSYSGQRSQTNWTAWLKGADGRWQRNARMGNGAYWIDLLIASDQPIRFGQTEEESEQPLRSYYYDRSLILEGDFTRYTRVELRVYSMLGELIHREERPFLGRQLRYPLHLPQGHYVASFTLHRQEERTLKPERHTLYFVQP